MVRAIVLVGSFRESRSHAARSPWTPIAAASVEAPSPEYEEAFAAMEREGAQALVVLEEPINQAYRMKIAELATAHRLPTVFRISMIDAGALIAYGTGLREAARHMAHYADKIVRGANPGDLPSAIPRAGGQTQRR